MKRLFFLACILSSVLMHGQSVLDMNPYIDMEQRRIDSLDGIMDGQINLRPGDEQKQRYRLVYFKLADSLQGRINYSGSLLNWQKKNLLYGLAMTLGEVTGKTYSLPLYYQKLMENAFGIVSATERGDVMSYLITDPLYSIKNIYFFKYDKEAQDFLIRSTFTYPDEVLKAFNKYKERPYKDTVVEVCAVIAPNVAKNYLLGETEIKDILKNNTNSSVMGMLAFFKVYNILSKGMVIVDDIVEGNITVEEAHYTAQDKRKFLRKLIEIRNSSYAQALYSLDEELHNTSLEYIRQINELHNEPDPKIRFACIDDFNWKELYTLLIYSEEEIFTSTFNGVFERLIYRLHQDKLTGDKMVEKLKYNRFRTFIKLCANYNKLGEFLSTMPRDKSRELIAKFTNNLDQNEGDLRSAINVANAFSSVTDSSLLHFMRSNIMRENERVNYEGSRGGIVIYGLLKSLFISAKNKDSNYYSGIAAKYKLEPIDRLEKRKLFGRGRIHRQIHFFYDDEDGEATYSTFISTFSGGNYRIINKGKIVLIESTKGEKVHIYANQPKSEYEGQAVLIQIMDSLGKDVQMMVHRGHSYYAMNTIDHIPPTTNIVFLGSCGSYHNIHEVLQHSQNVHIISSKQIGVMAVNNPLLFNIAETVREGKDLVWAELWKRTEMRILKDRAAMEKFRDYVSPDKNLGAIFLQAYTRWVTSNQSTNTMKVE